MPRPRRRESTPPGGSTLTGTRLLRENLPRPATPAPGAPVPAAGPRRGRFSFFRKFEPRFIADIVSELKKVTWPTFGETRYLTVVVAIVALAVGILLGGVDIVFGWVIEKLFF